MRPYKNVPIEKKVKIGIIKNAVSIIKQLHKPGKILAKIMTAHILNT